MARSGRDRGGKDDEPRLFDLPLAPEPPPPSRPAAAGELGPPVPARPAPERLSDRPSRPRADRREPAAAGAQRATLGGRIAAGAADLLVHAALTVAALGGTRLLGVRPVASDWPAVVFLVAAFSFLYTVVPLAFWGQTLGMVWAGLVARSLDGEPLAFDQSARRWLGMVLTTLTLGLPLLFAVRGRSLTDRLSGSETRASG